MLINQINPIKKWLLKYANLYFLERIYYVIIKKYNKFTFLNIFFVLCLINVRKTKKILFINTFSSLWSQFRFWFFGILLSISFFYFALFLKVLSFPRIVFSYLLLILFLYWTISSFVYLFRSSRVSSYTTAIQRFWKRTFTIFWAIEIFLFFIFLYFTCRASVEPVYSFDQIKLFRSGLVPILSILWSLFLFSIVIVVSFYLLLFFKNTTFSRNCFVIFFVTLLLLYLVWRDFYQFFFVLSYYGSLTWDYNTELFFWELSTNFKKNRLSNYYVALCLILKFWHMVFVFIFWVFFVVRSLEVKRFRYGYMSTCFQNFLIVYFLTLLPLYSLGVFLFKPVFINTFYYFFTECRLLTIRLFFFDLLNIYIGAKELLFFKYKNSFYITDFFYLNEQSSAVNFNGVKASQDLYLIFTEIK